MPRSVTGIPDTTRAGKLLRLPLQLIGPSTVVRVLQGPLCGKKWIAGSTVHGCWLGTYERTKVSRFAASLSPGDIVFDLGANVGLYSLLAAVRVGCAGQVIAFEPLARNLRYLRAHLQLNSAHNVRVVGKAVSDRTGSGFFRESRSASMGCLSEEGTLVVDTITLDDFLRSGGPAPQCIKIDVEGAEAKVLAGGQETLTRYRPVIFLALHSRSLHELCVEQLQSHGYECEQLEGLEADGPARQNQVWRAEIIAIHSSRLRK
jgi:FkbM family methyltransferase